MTFARRVFLTTGLYGVIVIAPQLETPNVLSFLKYQVNPTGFAGVTEPSRLAQAPPEPTHGSPLALN